MKMSDPVNNVTGIKPQHEEAMPVLSSEVMKTAAGAGSSETIQAVPEPEPGREDMGAFFGIGIVVNLTVFTVLLVWGFNQWKKNDARKK